MEIVAALVFLILVGYCAYLIRCAVNERREYLEAAALAERERERFVARCHARREAAREKTLSYAVANTKAVPPAKPSYAPSPTQSVTEYQDNTASDIALAMAIHSISNTQVSHPSPTVKSNESSWGFDDSDSRRSASSSFSSSDSSSSSDSGPSSDW